MVNLNRRKKNKITSLRFYYYLLLLLTKQEYSNFSEFTPVLAIVNGLVFSGFFPVITGGVLFFALVIILIVSFNVFFGTIGTKYRRNWPGSFYSRPDNNAINNLLSSYWFRKQKRKNDIEIFFSFD